MKISNRTGKPILATGSPFEPFSYPALQQLLSYVAAGSKEHEMILTEQLRRKKEPKQDPDQALLFNGSEWAATRSPWCIEAFSPEQNPIGKEA